ncbi:hypothetical protein PWEIH_14861 [Listeria weihenstephanensis FSL R9-0317]|uniref:Uncharacterized protein n=1 Tax=Listeria weihenstephanensis TaxID=1006155 RepID=A0A1S7FVK0_9LIST|nr:hypothetical protein [Listeria weihenstephanensis]AQY51476.1 hypothetical protein UE46_10795 [Listeria weihenstephanensis]EUJ35834.1 hypothetical protein PWEIH_14861 [Listeria weihenstephanensis FSL R9-0317]
MSFELNVLVLDQEQPTYLDDYDFIVEIANERDNEEIFRRNGWDYMNQQSGIWYNLGIEEDGGFWALRMLDADFDTNYSVLPYWIDDESVTSNLYPLTVVERYRRDVERILELLLEGSPKRTVYIMSRMQGWDTEIIVGPVSLKRFWELHDAGKVLFNVCYLIKE